MVWPDSFHEALGREQFESPDDMACGEGKYEDEGYNSTDGRSRQRYRYTGGDDDSAERGTCHGGEKSQVQLRQAS